MGGDCCKVDSSLDRRKIKKNGRCRDLLRNEIATKEAGRWVGIYRRRGGRDGEKDEEKDEEKEEEKEEGEEKEERRRRGTKDEMNVVESGGLARLKNVRMRVIIK